jgi:hypothetical protein
LLAVEDGVVVGLDPYGVYAALDDDGCCDIRPVDDDEDDVT